MGQPFGHSRGFGKPGPATGPHPSGPPPSEALGNFRQRMAAKVSFEDDSVMALAESLGREFALGFRREKRESGRTQVRKVYGEVRALQEKAKGGFDKIRPELRLIQAHVAYAVGRDTLTPLFKQFADEAIARLLAAGTKDELDRFVKFFEAMYAHFYFHTSKYGQREG